MSPRPASLGARSAPWVAAVLVAAACGSHRGDPPATAAGAISPAAASAAVASAIATPAISPSPPSRAAGEGPASRRRHVMIVAPHPDDEVLTAAGRIFGAVAAGDAVTIVVVTNGDASGGTLRGYERQGESIDALSLLGVDEEHVVFLGYGNGSLRQLYDSALPHQVHESVAGRRETYGNRGAGGMEYHRRRHGAPGAYSRASLLSDLIAVLGEHRPDEIYTVSPADDHPDHQATALFVAEALAALQRGGTGSPTQLYETLVWKRCGVNWPDTGRLDPSSPHAPPPCLESTSLRWDEAVRFPLPPGMTAGRDVAWGARARSAGRCLGGALSRPAATLSTGSRLRLGAHDVKACWRGLVRRTPPGGNLKLAAIQASSAAGNPFYLGFVRADEFFWRTDAGRQLGFSPASATSRIDAAP